MAFRKPRIISFQYIDQDGESHDFFARKPSLREMARTDKLKDANEEAQLIATFERFLVNEDGTPLSRDRIDEIIDSDLTDGNAIVEQMSAVLQLKKAQEKKD